MTQQQPIFATAQGILTLLQSSLTSQQLIGTINFNMASIPVVMTSSDTVGSILQSWLKAYFDHNNIYYAEPCNTQAFPDFYLSQNPNEHLLEIKAFRKSNGPAFDIANFYAYCESVQNNPQRLFADYLIFGYNMDNCGVIKIEDIWLCKIWEIAGASDRFPLKTQVKRNQIYNIRPNSSFVGRTQGIFTCPEDFIRAVHQTMSQDPNRPASINPQIWLTTLQNSYFTMYNTRLII